MKVDAELCMRGLFFFLNFIQLPLCQVHNGAISLLVIDLQLCFW